jgi:hypothetical protein
MLNLGPCSMLPPHLHARGTNYVVAVHGNTTTYMYEENGARLVTQVLTPGTATIFPQASMHMMMNTGMFFALALELHACDLKARFTSAGATGAVEVTKSCFLHTATNQPHRLRKRATRLSARLRRSRHTERRTSIRQRLSVRISKRRIRARPRQ